jgi:hypothetical protein
LQGIYTYIPETNHVPKDYNVAAILSLLFMAPILLLLLLLLNPRSAVLSEEVKIPCLVNNFPTFMEFKHLLPDPQLLAACPYLWQIQGPGLSWASEGGSP